MTALQAIVLGIVEGLTEYLPISSTGHLILAQRAMGIANSEAADAYAICIQAGAIAAVLGLYAKQVRAMCQGMLGRDLQGAVLARNVLAAFVPAMIVGLFFHKGIEEHLFGLYPVVFAWYLGGAAILMVSWYRDPKQGKPGKPLAQLTLNQSLLIGLAQCLAMWPGTSRSLVTIVAALLVGLSIQAAVEFSFLLGLLTLTAATGYTGLKSGGVLLEQVGVVNMVLGFVVAAAAAVVSVRWMVRYLQGHSLEMFGYYRVGLALAVTGLLVAGLITTQPVLPHREEAAPAPQAQAATPLAPAASDPAGPPVPAPSDQAPAPPTPPLPQPAPPQP